jgi:hypothetical protein
MTMPPEDRQALLADVRVLLDGHPALQRGDEIDLPYVTRCTRCDLTTG